MGAPDLILKLICLGIQASMRLCKFRLRNNNTLMHSVFNYLLVVVNPQLLYIIEFYIFHDIGQSVYVCMASSRPTYLR